MIDPLTVSTTSELDALRAEVASLRAALDGNSHHVLLSTQRQRAALVAERDALREQVAAVVTERDTWYGETCRLRRILAAIVEIGYNHEITDAAERMLRLAQDGGR